MTVPGGGCHVNRSGEDGSNQSAYACDGGEEHEDVDHDGEDRVPINPYVDLGPFHVPARSASSRNATRPWLTRRLMLVVREPMAAARLAYE